MRCYRIAYVLDVAARDRQIPDSEIELLVRALYFHHETLTREKFFRRNNNHGIYQALGQIAAARRFAYLPEMLEHHALAAARIRRLVENHVFPSGVHKEHSPGYHHMILQSLVGAKNAGLFRDQETLAILESMEEALAWMIMPDALLAPIGDTHPIPVCGNGLIGISYSDPRLIYLMSDGKLGTAPEAGVHAFTDAGYVFARVPNRPGQSPKEWTYFAQMAGFHSRTHKHADHLSFVWHDRGRLVLADPGFYGYLGRTDSGSALAKDGFYYSDPKRIYVESTGAHNTVMVDGRNFQRVGVKPFGSAIVYAGEQQGMIVSECQTCHFDAIGHRRIVVLAPGQFLLVMDALCDPNQQRRHDFIQRFHFAPTWEVEERRGGWLARDSNIPTDALRVVSLTGTPNVAAVRGQKEPELLGWCSDNIASLVPTTSIAFEQKGSPTALFATLFACAERISVVAARQRLQLSLDDVHLAWATPEASFELTISRDAEGVIAAGLVRG